MRGHCAVSAVGRVVHALPSVTLVAVSRLLVPRLVVRVLRSTVGVLRVLLAVAALIRGARLPGLIRRVRLPGGAVVQALLLGLLVLLLLLRTIILLRAWIHTARARTITPLQFTTGQIPIVG